MRTMRTLVVATEFQLPGGRRVGSSGKLFCAPRQVTTMVEIRLLRRLVAAVAIWALPHFTFAQCESFDSDTTALGLTPAVITTVGQNFTVCYDPDFADDLALFREWIPKGMELGLQKYGFVGPLTRDGEPADVVVFLPPRPTTRTRRGYIGFTTGRRSDLSNGAWRAELHYLTPSAWGNAPYGGLSYPSAEEYHAHYIVHETMHVVQFGLEDTKEYEAPKWIWEALAEYDGYLHTTEWNRTEAIYRLFDRSEEKDLPAKIYCCRTLRGGNSAIVTTDVYYAGAIVMMFLAENFGAEIHRDLFDAPMAELIAGRGNTVDATFTQFQTWYPEKLDEIFDVPGTDYTPSMACTGRYWYHSGGISFEVRILNNEERPAAHEVFRQQYRRDASHPWTTDGGARVIGSTSGFSTPLFTSPSSPPFQWRARSCPAGTETDRACSNWSNIINWTAARCASTRSGTSPTFTDDPLIAGSTPVKAIHFRELRQRIGTLRAQASLLPMKWTDPTLTAGVTPVKRVHLTELWAGLTTVYDAVGKPRPSYTDAEATTRDTPIKAVHVMELRDAVAALEAVRAPDALYSTERSATDRYRHLADVNASAGERRESPEELHDHGDLHEAPALLQ